MLCNSIPGDLGERLKNSPKRTHETRPKIHAKSTPHFREQPKKGRESIPEFLGHAQSLLLNGKIFLSLLYAACFWYSETVPNKIV
mgnify:CR=1 FL=1